MFYIPRRNDEMFWRGIFCPAWNLDHTYSRPPPTLHITGTVQTFTAPVSGIYEFELWGSPGGEPGVYVNDRPCVFSNGGYTKFYIKLYANKKCTDPDCTITGSHNLHVFVGGAGENVPSTVGGIAEGGYNGGGYTVRCSAGAHSGSGGGMTHVSYTNNLAITTCTKSGNKYTFGGNWSPDGTIGVAGGGGGGCSAKLQYIKDNGDKVKIVDAGTGNGGGNITSYEQYPINVRSRALYNTKNNKSYTTITPAKNATTYTDNGAVLSGDEIGFARGIGQGACSSSGGGGGWIGGNSLISKYPAENTTGALCGMGASGGTGYICNAGKQTEYTSYNRNLNGSDPSIPSQPNANTSLGIHGYTKITIIKRQ